MSGSGYFLARLGGDEFGLLAPGSDEIGARVLAKRLADALPQGVSASVGVATWDRAEGASDLLRRADQVMYRNKRRRRAHPRRRTGAGGQGKGGWIAAHNAASRVGVWYGTVRQGQIGRSSITESVSRT